MKPKWVILFVFFLLFPSIWCVPIRPIPNRLETLNRIKRENEKFRGETNTTCLEECVYGDCTLIGDCICWDGFKGDHCKIRDPCYQVHCLHGGYCSEGVCLCPPNKAGMYCQYSSCSQKGIFNPENQTCICFSGWSGSDCSVCNIKPSPGENNICFPLYDNHGYVLITVSDKEKENWIQGQNPILRKINREIVIPGTRNKKGDLLDCSCQIVGETGLHTVHFAKDDPSYRKGMTKEELQRVFEPWFEPILQECVENALLTIIQQTLLSSFITDALNLASRGVTGPDDCVDPVYKGLFIGMCCLFIPLLLLTVISWLISYRWALRVYRAEAKAERSKTKSQPPQGL